MAATTDRREWVLERRWDRAARPLPRRWIAPPHPTSPGGRPFDFTAGLRRLCEDVVVRCPEFRHIDPAAVLFSFTPARNRRRHGLQARLTPMRFRDGHLTRRVRGTDFQVQRYFVDGREMLYVVTFCLPRFLDQPFDEKLVTVFHELYHIGPRFDGDLRRHEGRYAVHSHSKKDYDRRMGELVRRYLAGRPDPDRFAFLRAGASAIGRHPAGVHGIHVPQPKMVPLT